MIRMSIHHKAVTNIIWEQIRWWIRDNLHFSASPQIWNRTLGICLEGEVGDSVRQGRVSVKSRQLDARGYPEILKFRVIKDTKDLNRKC
jgi:hypothetical protein